MKMSKRILSSLMAILMIVSVCSVGFTANAAKVTLEEIDTKTTIARPVVSFTCTEITRVAMAVNSVEPGNVIVKSTPSGVPELSGSYVDLAYAGETPVGTTIVFSNKTTGVQVIGFSCNNPDVVVSPLTLSGSNYVATIESGTVTPAEDGTYKPLVFTVDYEYIDGRTYQEKCVSYVESVATGGSYGELQTWFRPWNGTNSRFGNYCSAYTRLMGKGVYYEQPEKLATSADAPYKSYGVYNMATGTVIDKVASGYNTSIYRDDKDPKKSSAAWDVSIDQFLPDVTPVHVYIDSSVSTTLADQNIRLDSNTGPLSSRNNDNPYTALADAFVFSGSVMSQPSSYANDATARSAIGFSIPEKADYGVKQSSENASMTTLTGGVGAYGRIFTQPLTGRVKGLVDASSYTIVLRYYSYLYAKEGAMKRSNMTNNMYVPVSMTFHVVDKTALRNAINTVLNTDPEKPDTRGVQGKGINPQAWFYKSGFENFQSAYVNASV